MRMGVSEEGDGWGKVAKVVAGVAVAGGVGYLLYRTCTGTSSPKSHPDDPEAGKSKRETHSTAKSSRGTGKEGLLGFGKEKDTSSPVSVAADLKNQGNAQFKTGQYKDAIRLYSEAIHASTSGIEDPTFAAACYQNRAAANEKLDHWEDVIEDCTEAISRNPKYIKAYQRRGKAHERCFKFQEALYDFTASCLLEQFSNYSTMENADRVLKSLSDEKAKATIQDRQDVNIPLSTTFVESYLSSFCEDPVLNAFNSKPNMANGDSNAEDKNEGFEEVQEFMNEKKYNEVSAACSRVIEKGGGKELEARLLRSTFSLIQGKTTEATEDFQFLFATLQQAPQDEVRTRAIKANAFVKRGSFHMQQGRKEECLQDFELASQVAPDNADIYHHRGQLLILMNEIEKARDDFNKCVKLRPDFAVARVQSCYADYRYAVMQDSMMETNNAIVRFEEIVREFPTCAEGYALLGQVYVERQCFADAEVQFDKALELSPSNANIYVHKGLLALNRSEDFDAAKSCIQKALKVDPYSEFAYETLGTIEVQRGRITEAVKCFDEALALARTELELVHIYSLREAAMAQIQIAKMLGIQFPGLM